LEEMNKLTKENALMLAMKERQIAREEEALNSHKGALPLIFRGRVSGIMGRAGNGVDGIWEVSSDLSAAYFWSKQKPA
jgi:hypothetical protein